MSVLFPIPGSPPISTSDPGTMPPPSTRSNSSMPEGTRDSSPESIASKGFGLEAPTGRVIWSGRPLPGGGALSALLHEAVPVAAVGASPEPLGALEAARLAGEERPDLRHTLRTGRHAATRGSRSA